MNSQRDQPQQPSGPPPLKLREPVLLDEEGREIQPKAEEEQPLVDHLSELRTQLVKSAFVFSFFLIAVFLSINYWFPVITRNASLVVLGPLEIIKFYTTISVALALGLSLPFFVQFCWKFVKPGLLKKEIHFLNLYAPAMFLLFVFGVLFGYFIVNPLSYRFLLAMGAVNFEVIVTAGEYVQFLLMTTVPLGFLFELPIVALFLSSIGVLTAASMRKVRKYAYLAITILSAVITPPDFISQLIVLFPMAILYEFSIFLIVKVERRRALRELKERTAAS